MFPYKEFLDKYVDRRAHERKSVLLEAAISDGALQEDSVLLNISEGGAMLRVSDPFMCPTSLDVEISRIGSIPAEVAWRRDDKIGVRFKESPQIVARRFEGFSSFSKAA